MNRVRLIAVLALPLVLASVAQAGLTVGDDAPPLTIAKWIKGEPVDMKAGRGRNIYVVEFWATWCGPCRESIPHLTELQKKLKKDDVVFVGISDEAPSKIEPFVKRFGNKMDYTVAADKNQMTSKAYLAAAGANGIPYAFIIDKSGKIAWHCHPMDPQFERALDEIVAGTFDSKKLLAEQEKMQKVYMQLQQAYSKQDWDGMLAAAEELKKLSGDQAQFEQIRFNVFLEKGEYDKAEKSGEALIEMISQPSMLNEFAWDLLTNDHMKGKFNALALKTAKKANDATNGEDWNILDTYARALYVSGDKDGAIKHEKKAIALAENAQETRSLASLKASLSEFESGQAGG